MAKKFENIFIASDLDGTFFASKTQMVKRNLEKIEYFCENGGRFTFATGRLPLFIKRPIPNPETIVNFPAVMGNGTCLFDYQNQRAVEEHFVDAKLLADVEDFLIKETGFEAAIRATFAQGVVMSTLENPALKREFETFPEYVERVVCSAHKWEGYNLYKANIRGTLDVIQEMYPRIKKEFGDVLTVTTSANTMIELMPLGISKASMLVDIKEKILDKDTVLCTVGDYDNDLEMHSISDLAVCPSNANDAVKSVCKLQLCSNDDGVIADLIDYFDMNS
ncbi:MAG: HAD-IIB family hydrolase [Ruminococcaceae bacterium]|nr:HAD-IIB family hydrolase [Oscillospiraceae bacterium]